MSDSYQKIRASLPPDMKCALETFQRETAEIVDSIPKELKHDPPSDIYHYTTDMGLYGILESGRLWLTDVFALNDPSELHHGLALAADALECVTKEESDVYREFASVFKERVGRKFQGVAQFFVCSFSECGDDLGQWRGYAADGRGYVLGFDAELLKKSFLKSRMRNTFPVTYHDDKLKEIFNRIVEKALPLIPYQRWNSLSDINIQECENLLKECKQLMNVILAMRVLQASLQFKHMAYSNEKEYRFLHFDISTHIRCPEADVRPRGYELIRYRKFDWKSVAPQALKSIVIGPAADFEKSKRFAEDCLRESGIDIASVEISQSQIPYKPA